MKVNFKSILMLILIVLAVIIAVSFVTDRLSESEELSYGEVLVKFEKDDVLEATIDGDLNLILYTRKEISPGIYERNDNDKDSGNVYAT